MKFLRERLGEVVGRLIAPVVERISHARRARTFHPDGVVFTAEVTPLTAHGARLAGSALVRCSGALWRRGPQFPDALGMAIRFQGRPGLTPIEQPGDQDLLFATILSPLTMGTSPFTTDTTDFSHNQFWAVSPFDVPDVGRVKFKLRAVGTFPGAGNREERLREHVQRGEAIWELSQRKTFTTTWEPIARITLIKEADIDQAQLHFSVFNTGKGIIPRGFVHAIRKAAYPASQRGRPDHLRSAA